MPWFRLLVGAHHDKDEHGRDRLYQAVPGQQGPVFWSRHDLLLCNARGMGPKFERVPGVEPVAINPEPAAPAEPEPVVRSTPPHPDTPGTFTAPSNGLDEEFGPLETLTVPKLMRLADDEGIDLGRASKKDEIINVMRGARRQPKPRPQPPSEQTSVPDEL